MKYALNLVVDDQFIRPFVEGGVDFQDLLMQLKKQGIKVGFIDSILFLIKNRSDVPTNDKEVQKKLSKQKHLDQYTAFTRKEMEIIHCVAKGLRNSEIADKLFNSEQTIKKHLSNMFQKIQVRNRMNLISKAKELGMLE